MFEDETEKVARSKILEMVSQYCDKFHNKKGYGNGQRIPYATRVYDRDEMVNLVDSSLEFWLTSGRYTDEFESTFSKYIEAEHCALVNSGSSANLLAFMALTSPLLKSEAIRPGDEVITVACGFPTTVSPIIQFGAVPVFVDVMIPQYNLDPSQLDDAISNKTKAVMLAHTLGNPFDIEAIMEFCQDNDLWLIEDNCDALGSKYSYKGKKRFTGTVGDIGTSSFYPPHHMTTGEGGAVYTNDPLLYKVMLSMRDWGRDCVCPSGKDNLCGHRLDRKYGELPFGYDHKYVYSHFGYNLKATDLQAAIGCAQIKKLSSFTERRKHNFKRLRSLLLSTEEYFILPEPLPGSDPSWFGFLLTCKSGIERNKIVSYIESRGIQTRMLFAGNITRHPCFNDMRETKKGYRTVGNLSVTDRIMNDTFWVGVYPGMTDEMIDYIAKTIIESVRG